MLEANTNLAADKRGSSIGKQKWLSAIIRVHPRLMFSVALSICAGVGIIMTSTRAQQTAPAAAPAPALEGCLKCHDKIEPMHKFGPTATLDKLDHGQDVLARNCT